MTALILPRRFTQQPQGPVEVDWNNPLSRGLMVCLDGARRYVIPRAEATFTSVGASVTRQGRALSFNGSGSRIIGGANAFGGATTKLFVGSVASFVNWPAISAFDDGTSLCGFWVSDTGYLHIRQSKGQIGLTASSEVIGVGEVFVGAGVFSTTVGRRLFKNGILCGADSNTTSADAVSSLNIGTTNRYGNENYLNGSLNLFLQWGRALSDSEVADISVNPWQIFRPRRQVLYFDVGGSASDTTSAADSGTLTLTGSAADGIRALLSAADAGTLTLTGSAADGLLARLGVAESGSLTLTGSAADALRALAGVAGSGSITLTGSDAAGVYTPVGDTPSAADSGSLTLTGSAAVGTYDRLAAADSGSLTLTGVDAAGQIQAPGAYTSDADTGSLTLVGYAANGVFAGAVTLTQADIAAIAAAVWAEVLEGALTAADMQRIKLAALAGKRQGLGTATEEYMAQDGVTPRITFSPTDDQGNGTTVVDGA